MLQRISARLARPRLQQFSTHALATPPRISSLVVRTAAGTSCGLACGLAWAQLHRAPAASCDSAPSLLAEAAPIPLKRTLSHSDVAVLARRTHEDVGSWLMRALRKLARILYLSAVISPLLLTLPLTRFASTSDLWWSCCVRACEHSGALLIKLAQWSSSRPDLFGEAACSRFAHLQDATTPHAWAETERTLAREFGAEWRARLRLDEASPLIGSGCIAQVYRGELRGDDGEWRPVAVKVLHPRVREYIGVDMDLLRSMGWALERIPKVRWLNPSGMLDEFAGLLLMQLDLTIEANNLDSFRRHFPAGQSDVDFPDPKRPYVTADVLVESFVEGVPFLQWAQQPAIAADEAARQRICTQGVDAVIKMIFVRHTRASPTPYACILSVCPCSACQRSACQRPRAIA